MTASVSRRARRSDGFVHGPGAALGPASALPPAWQEGVSSFYDLLRDPSDVTRCRGTACTFARSDAAGGHAVCCLGRCYEAPANPLVAPAPIPRRCLAGFPVVLRHVLREGHDPWSDYALPGAGQILNAIESSNLRGRGGAAYPTAAKWATARDTVAPDRYVIANGDEGDPGAFVDRLLLEEAPHSVLAGMVACARAIGATRGIVYVRGEYPLAARRVEEAIEDAGARGMLAPLQVSVVRGAGSYVAGEETALLRSLEGLRAEPAAKPPYPAERGLHGLPTVVQNVETLSLVPWIVRHGGHAGRKAVCVSGCVTEPGVVEIELGTSLRRVLEEGAGGVRRGARWRMALVGGPLGRVVPADEFDVPLSFDVLPGMGHGGIVALDESVSPRRLALHLFEFARSESCGSCTPCRAGTAQLHRIGTVPGLRRLLQTLEDGSLCAFGQGVTRPIRDLLNAYGTEVVT